jgi:hypothetical protein
MLEDVHHVGGSISDRNWRIDKKLGGTKFKKADRTNLGDYEQIFNNRNTCDFDATTIACPLDIAHKSAKYSTVRAAYGILAFGITIIQTEHPRRTLKVKAEKGLAVK